MSFIDLSLEKDATLSPDRVYRYALWRTWGKGPPALWIMLNPSTADERIDDPTIRRCIGFSKQWGFGGVIVANLFALRATQPKTLRTYPDPVGPYNNDAIVELSFAAGSRVICAWGNHGTLYNRGPYVLEMLGHLGHRRMHLGLTRSGQPKHPLYLSAETKMQEYP